MPQLYRRVDSLPLLVNYYFYILIKIEGITFFMEEHRDALDWPPAVKKFYYFFIFLNQSTLQFIEYISVVTCDRKKLYKKMNHIQRF